MIEYLIYNTNDDSKWVEKAKFDLALYWLTNKNHLICGGFLFLNVTRTGIEVERY